MLKIWVNVVPGIAINLISHHLNFPPFAGRNIGNDRILFVDFLVL